MAEPTQSGTFVGGLMRGWEFGKGLQRREKQEEREQARFEQEQQLNELQTEASKIELESTKAQQRRDDAIRSLAASEQAYASGNQEMAVDQLRQGLESLDMDIEDVNPEYARSLDQLSRAMKNPGSVSRGDLVEPANRVFRRQINKGVGPLDEPIERNGRTISEITDKRIAEVAPSPTDDGRGNQVEPGIMARMEVTGKTPDGETVTWRAPVTANRSARDDDPAQSIPLEEITKQVVGRKQLMSGLAQSPEFRGILRAAKARAGGETEEVEYGTETVNQGDQEVTYLTEDGVPTQPFATAPRESGGTERDRKIQALSRRPGVSEDDAVDIVDGVKVLTDPDQFGRQFIVDKLTGEKQRIVARGDRQGSGGGGTADESGAGGAAPAPAESVDIAGAVEEGTGPFAKIRSVVNSTIGPFVEGSPFPDTEAAKENIRLFNFQMQQAFAQNDGRLSNFEREIIQRFQPDPDRVFTDPDSERQKIIEMRDFLEKQMEQNRQSIEGGEVTSDQRGKLANQNATIERLLAIMGDVGGQRYTADSPAEPQTQEEFDNLPSGAVFRNPATGELRRKQ